MTKYQTLSFEQKENQTWILTIQRPESLNALNSLVFEEMTDVIKKIQAMSFSEIRSLIITGSGEKAFVAGADIKELAGLNEEQGKLFAKKGQQVFFALTQLKVPVIAAVNGFALGGGLELALGCDFIFASSNAKFSLPEVSLGLIPGFAGTVRLAQAVGLRRAQQMTLTGEMITAETAERWGLVNKVTNPGEVVVEALKTSAVIATRSPMAVKTAKHVIYKEWDLAMPDAEESEASAFGSLFITADMKEGTQAFIEKRKSLFKGF